MSLNLLQYKPKPVKLATYGKPVPSTSPLYSGPPAPVAPKVGAAANGTIGTYGPPAPDWAGPVQPNPKPPAQKPSYAFSIDDDPFVKAARNAMSGIVDNAQRSARGSIIGRLLQYGDPGLSGLLSKGALQQYLGNINMGGLGSQAIDLLNIDPATAQQIAQQYGAESDPAVARDLGPAGVSLKAQFDRAMAQDWRARIGSLTGRGAVRSGDLGYQTREQGLQNDVGVQNLVQSLLGGIGQDVSGVDTARQTAQRAIDDAIQNARNSIIQNPEQYAALMGLTPAVQAPPAATSSPPPSSSSLQSLLTPQQYGILQSAMWGGAR